MTQDDEKIRIVIGNLLSKADQVSKTVLSSFDPSKVLDANAKILGGPRFTQAVLQACAQFLNINLVDDNNNKIFTNKISFAKRIILEIQSFYPALCSSCDAEYSVEFDSNPPALRCFLCFQGCHDCSSFASPDSLSASPIGTVWLCRSCHILNNPVKQKRSKGTISTSNAASNAPTESNIPVQNSEIKVTTATVNKLTPNKSPDICEKFKIGKCPHGISGKTLHEGFACNKSHPKWCYRSARNGKRGKYGCRKGDNCIYYHPKHCPSSVSDKTCFAEECTLVHLVGTKRQRRPKEQSYIRSDHQHSRSRDSSRNSNARQNNLPSKPHQKSKTDDSQDNANFLELRSLLTSFQENIQKEIESLKSDTTSQEIRLASILPSSSQYVIKQFLPQAHLSHTPQTFHHQSLPPPHFQQPHPLQQSVSWNQFPVSGC